MADLLHVQPTARTGQVLLWERHAAHPDGECWIVADDRVYVVGHTTAITGLLTSGALAVAAAAPEPEPEAAPEPDAEPKPAPKRGK